MFVGDDRRMQTWIRTVLLQMLEVTTTGSHSYIGSEALDEVCHCLINVFLWQLIPDGLQGSFQFISRLSVWLEFMAFLQHVTPDMIVQMH